MVDSGFGFDFGCSGFEGERGGLNRVINREARLFVKPWRCGGWQTIWLRGNVCWGVTYLGGSWFTGGEGGSRGYCEWE